LQEQAAIAWPQSGHSRPDSVEYTDLLSFMTFLFDAA